MPFLCVKVSVPYNKKAMRWNFEVNDYFAPEIEISCLDYSIEIERSCLHYHLDIERSSLHYDNILTLATSSCPYS